MADDAGGDLSVPSTSNWNEWTFEQALKALTGEGADLHTPAKASWFTFNPNPTGSDNIHYHAFDTYWYGVNIDQQAVTTWTKAIDTIDEMMADVSRGRRGSMDHQSLLDLAQAVRTFADFNHGAANIMTSWANRLDSDDSSFRGKAAFLIQWRLKAGGDGLTDTYEQVTTRHGKNIADVVNDAAVELGNFNKTMSDAWQVATIEMRNWLNGLLTDAINDVAGYIFKSGLDQHHGPYILEAFNGDTESGKAFVRKTLQAYPKGDLTTAAGWQSISTGITKDLTNFLDLLLDQPARGAITALAPKYTLATSSLIEITAPPTETPPQPDPDTDGTGDGDLPPPDGSGSGDVPPPPDGGGSGDVPAPPDGGGSGDVPAPPDGGGSGEVPSPDGGIGDAGLGDGGIGDAGLGDGGLNGPPGTGGDVPADGGIGPFVPGLVPPGGGTGTGDDRANGGTGIGPGGDGAFDEAGGENGLLRPPGGGAGDPKSLLPPGAGDSRTAIPPGSGLNEIGHSGFGTDPGKGLGGGGSGVGLGNGGLGGGAGGFGSGTGSGGLNGLNGLPTQLSGGFPGANGAPGTSGGGSGVPFFPPMMGGAGQGGAGEKPKERERQTWLSEDEEIWGTRVAVGSGVVGRLDDEEFGPEELPLAGPSRRIRRSETPRRRRPAEEAAREATTAVEEASGSA